MAVRSFVVTANPPTQDYDGITVGTWAGLAKTTDDTGDPVALPNRADRTVQVVGTFGTGGNVRIEGSIDGANYAVLTDPQGNALDITAAKIESISEVVRYIRPRVTAGDVATSLAVSILLKR